MKLLLDTHVALWTVTGDAKLGAKAMALLADADSEVFVSTASIWEIAIKHPLQRGSRNDMPISGGEAMHHFTEAGYTMLPITPDHAAAIDTLPPLHGDPFDRMLVAQALAEPLHLLTRDARLLAYGAMVIQV